MVRWFGGAMAAAMVMMMAPALSGCTEPEPLYCDAEHPCTQPGYTCMYSRRTCIFKGEGDSGGDTSGGGDQATPDAGADQGPAPDTGAGPDGPGQDSGAGADGGTDQ